MKNLLKHYRDMSFEATIIATTILSQTFKNNFIVSLLITANRQFHYHVAFSTTWSFPSPSYSHMAACAKFSSSRSASPSSVCVPHESIPQFLSSRASRQAIRKSKSLVIYPHAQVLHLDYHHYRVREGFY